MTIIACPDNRWKYRVISDEYHITRVKRPGSGKRFENRWIGIDVNGFIIIKSGYAFDGATLVPDMYFAVMGAAFHDPLYQFAKEIAEAWGCSTYAVIRFADKVFFEVMKNHSKGYNIWPAIYYGGVSVFGYPCWKIKHRFKQKK